MALPPKDQQEPAFSRYGIVVGLYPSSDPAFDIEIHRTRGSSASTGFTEIAQLNGMGLRQYVYEDLLPNDNVTSWYKARHVLPGYTDGAFTTAVKAKPTLLLNSPDATKYPHVQLSGAALTANIQLSSAKAVQFGGAVSGGTKTKTIRIPYTEFVAATSTMTFNYGNGSLQGTASGPSDLFWGPPSVPNNATIIRMRMRGRRQTTGATLQADLYRVDSTGGSIGSVVTLASTVSNGTYHTKTSSVMTVTMSTVYTWSIRLLARNGTSGSVAFQHAEFDYTIPDYDVAI